MRLTLPALLFLLLFSGAARSQTVGLFQNTPESYNGYTLFSGYMGDTVYLIDNCGKLINKWSSHYRSSRNSVVLLEDGNVLYGAKVSTVFNSGSGMFQKQDWNGNVVWSYSISDSFQCAHHGFKAMPNGNILAAVWEKKSPAEQIAAGRNPAGVNGTLWVDKIMEIQPVGTDSAVIVWEWKLWDHLVQDFDATKANYAPVVDHPELVDINLLPGTTGSWAHVNAVDYNPELNQVLICSRNFNEILIVDHSTTTAEAAGHTGGQRGVGGDLLYRWGNPFNYQHGSVVDQKLYHQHDAHWIAAGLPGAGSIMIFNNGDTRPSAKYSSVDIIQPPLLPDSSYDLQLHQPYGPATHYWTYPKNPDTTFYTVTQGSAQKMPNGNVLISESNSGDFQEVDTSGNLVWRYVSPVNIASINTQGTPPGDNGVFSMRRYPASFPGFAGKTLTPGAPIEINPLPYICTIHPVGIDDSYEQQKGFSVVPNPAGGRVRIGVPAAGNAAILIQLVDLSGRVILKQSRNAVAGKNEYPIDLHSVAKGMYVVQVKMEGRTMQRKLIVE